MKLDRNINRGGRGKYALVNMRKLIPLIERRERATKSLAECELNQADLLSADEIGLLHCFEVLLENGIITLGNETPGDQFFVLKYKDRFTAQALFAYAFAVGREASLIGANGDTATAQSLSEYAVQIRSEALSAEKLGNRIPD